MKHLVGILGPSGGGKSSLCKGACELDSDFGIISFADYLKEEATRRGWSGLKDSEGRLFLQRVSEDMKQEFGESVFFDEGVKKALASNKSCILFDDCRFLIEIAGLLRTDNTKFNGYVLLMHEDRAEKRWFDAVLSCDQQAQWANHRSECEHRAVRYALASKYPTFINDKSLGLEHCISTFTRLLQKICKKTEAASD